MIAIILRSQKEIERLRASNQVVMSVMAELKRAIQPGVTTLELDVLAERIIRKEGAIPAFKGYRGYKHTICASVNEEVVHGVPRRS